MPVIGPIGELVGGGLTAVMGVVKGTVGVQGEAGGISPVPHGE